MIFSSYKFILFFLPLTLAGFWYFSRYKAKTWMICWLIFCSLVFYSAWNPRFLLVLIFSTLVNAALGKLILSSRLSHPPSARRLLIAGLIFNIGLLAYFKYTGFFIENLDDLFGRHLAAVKVVIPLGISFFTFQKIAFLVDAYSGKVKDFTFLNFLLFVTFFPQLIAGPIVHHSEMMPQFSRLNVGRKRSEDLALGLTIFIMGLGKKVLVADTCALYSDFGFHTIEIGTSLDLVSAWMTVLFYSLQLYYDFSGYSDMATGLARMFGIMLPLNFNSPYKAVGLIDFWRRWHITLSRFLRDYLYFPLGGNRRGPLRRYFNLLTVMLIGGLWHGANWTFVLWGGVHGLGLMAQHFFEDISRKWRWNISFSGLRVVGLILTFLFVVNAWVLFRSEHLRDALRMYECLWPCHTSWQASWESIYPPLHQQLYFTGHLVDLTQDYRPRDGWPPTPAFIGELKPTGFILVSVLLVTFLCPNLPQWLARSTPVEPSTWSEPPKAYAISNYSGTLALGIAGLGVLSLLLLWRVNSFIYFQF